MGITIAIRALTENAPALRSLQRIARWPLRKGGISFQVILFYTPRVKVEPDSLPATIQAVRLEADSETAFYAAALRRAHHNYVVMLTEDVIAALSDVLLLANSVRDDFSACMNPAPFFRDSSAVFSTLEEERVKLYHYINKNSCQRKMHAINRYELVCLLNTMSFSEKRHFLSDLSRLPGRPVAVLQKRGWHDRFIETCRSYYLKNSVSNLFLNYKELVDSIRYTFSLNYSKPFLTLQKMIFPVSQAAMWAFVILISFYPLESWFLVAFSVSIIMPYYIDRFSIENLIRLPLKWWAHLIS